LLHSRQTAKTTNKKIKLSLLFSGNGNVNAAAAAAAAPNSNGGGGGPVVIWNNEVPTTEKPVTTELPKTTEMPEVVNDYWLVRLILIILASIVLVGAICYILCLFIFYK